MRIHVLSDLHLEFADFTPPAVEADVVVLAGDVHPGITGLGWARRAFAGRSLVYVAGNHESYGESLPAHTERLRTRAATDGLHYLENAAVVIGGVRFLGCTLWTDFALHGRPAVSGHEATQRMNDFRKIRVDPEYRRLRSLDAARLHARSRQWLETELARDDAPPTVVVTHHAPSARSLEAGWEADELAAAYASHLDELLERRGPALWVHGHLHRSATYRIGGTDVVCNPRGYPDEPNAAFDPGLVVEVGA